MIWVGRLISFAIVLQTVEFFFVPPWNWKILRQEVPKLLRPLIKSNRSLLIFRLLAAIAVLIFPHPLFIFILWITTWGIAIRWRGTFNGGSDTMSFLIVTAWLVSALFPATTSICLLYIAIQLILSYFVAGIAKIISPQWRTGHALQYFLSRANIAISPGGAFYLSWVVLLFECLFPLAVFAPWPFLIAAMLFHLANAYIFGLNRFFFAWLAAYPALILSLAH